MFVWLYSLLSVLVVSLASLVGLAFFSLKEENLKKMLMILVSFSSGALFGDAFIHLIPEAMKDSFGIQVSLSIVFGIIVSFSIERFLQWRHCHIPTSSEHPHTFAYMNLFGDLVHNLIDGLIIGTSYQVTIQLGVATTLAIVFHEIPQEFGDFGVLIYGGFSKYKALFLNFLTALTAIFGAVLALSLSVIIQDFTSFLIPFAAGNFIYIAGSDLLPELRKEECRPSKSALQLTTFTIGVLVLTLLIFLE